MAATTEKYVHVFPIQVYLFCLNFPLALGFWLCLLWNG